MSFAHQTFQASLPTLSALILPRISTKSYLCSIRYYLSERFRLRFEDAGIEEMIAEEEAQAAAIEAAGAAQGDKQDHVAIHSPENDGGRPRSETGLPGSLPNAPLSNSDQLSSPPTTTSKEQQIALVNVYDQDPEPQPDSLDPTNVIRTLDGEIAGDEMEEEARNYQILLGKIDALLDRLRLDA